MSADEEAGRADGQPTADDNSIEPQEIPEVVSEEADRGRLADRPTDIPARGWWDVAQRVRAESKTDNVSLLSAGVAFYSLLALVPAIVAVVSVYGIAANPDEVRSQITDSLGAAPREVRELLSSQLESIASSSGGGTILAIIAGILAALWSASAGVRHLIEALNVAYDETEGRGFVRRHVIALAFTVAAVVFVVVAIGVIGVLPALLADTGLGAAGRIAVGILRWVLLLAGLVVGLAILYRYGPDRDEPRWRWVSPGALVAAVLWLIGSLLFSLYTANFSKYNETYGSLGAIVVLMLWLYLTSLSIVVGAEINAELERQTAEDTTRGGSQPLGRRGAYAADTVGESADEIRAGR